VATVARDRATLSLSDQDVIRQSRRHRGRTGAPQLGRAHAVGRFRKGQWLAETRMRQHESCDIPGTAPVAGQAVFTFTRRGTPPPDRGHMLTQAEIEALDKGGVDLPTAGG